MSIERLRLSLRCDGCGAIFHSDAEDTIRLRIDGSMKGWQYATSTQAQSKDVSVFGETHTRKILHRRHWDGCPDCDLPKSYEDFPVK